MNTWEEGRSEFLAGETSSITHFGGREGREGRSDGRETVSYYAILAATTHILQQQQQQHIEG